MQIHLHVSTAGHTPLPPSQDRSVEQIRHSPRGQEGSISNRQQDRSHHSQAQTSTEPPSSKKLNLTQPSSSHSQAGAATSSSSMPCSYLIISVEKIINIEQFQTAFLFGIAMHLCHYRLWKIHTQFCEKGYQYI